MFTVFPTVPTGACVVFMFFTSVAVVSAVVSLILKTNIDCLNID